MRTMTQSVTLQHISAPDAENVDQEDPLSFPDEDEDSMSLRTVDEHKV